MRKKIKLAMVIVLVGTLAGCQLNNSTDQQGGTASPNITVELPHSG